MTGRPPTFDMALALTTRRLDLPRDAAFALLAIGRTVGWLAHAMEQARSGSPFQPRSPAGLTWATPPLKPEPGASESKRSITSSKGMPAWRINTQGRIDQDE